MIGPGLTNFPSDGGYKVKQREHSIRGRDVTGGKTPEAEWVKDAVALYPPPERGYRFDDPLRLYNVAYTGTTPAACLYEVLQQFKPHAASVDAAKRSGFSGPPLLRPAGILPFGWIIDRELVKVGYEGNLSVIDVDHEETWSWLDSHGQVGTAIRAAGLGDPPLVNSGVLNASGSAGRRVTQVVSRVCHGAAADVGGIRYSSTWSPTDPLECWASFLDKSKLVLQGRKDLNVSDPDLAAVLKRLGIGTPWLPSDLKALLALLHP